MIGNNKLSELRREQVVSQTLSREVYPDSQSGVSPIDNITCRAHSNQGEGAVDGYIETEGVILPDNALPSFGDVGAIFFFECKTPLSSQIIGGKAANLSKLSDVKGIVIPKWFVLSTDVFKHFLQENEVLPLIDQLNELCLKQEDRSDDIQLLAKQIQEKIENGFLSSASFFSLSNALNRLTKELNTENFCFAVRSSGAMEDDKLSSCAGLYETVLNCQGIEEAARAIKKVWASAFAVQVVQERIRLGVSQVDCNMGVIIQEQIDSYVSGVASSVVLGNNYPGIEISANYGLGESVVGGEVSVDHWIMHPTHEYILEQTLGEKEFSIISNVGGGVKKQISSQEKRNAFVITPEQVKELAAQITEIRKHYECDVDVEFAFNASGKLLILQARPLVSVEMEKIQVVDLEEAKHHKILSTGLYSIPGVFTGQLVYVDSLADLVSGKIHLNKNDIVCAHVTTNVWSQYLANIGGLITKEGSSSSHSILLAREKRIPCVIGIREEFANLIKNNGQVVTIDGFNKVIYEGRVQSKEASFSDLKKQFDPIKLRTWPDLQTVLPHLIHNRMVIEKDGAYWRKTPTYPVVGFQQELNMLRFFKVPSLVGKVGIEEVRAQVIDGYTCNELVPFDEYMTLFDGFSIQKARDFNQAHRDSLQEFLDLSENFIFHPEHWHKYIDAYSRLRAYVWLGGGYRALSERKVDEMGIALQVPTLYLEACSQEIQDNTSEIDIKMHKAIYELAYRIKDKNLPGHVDQLSVLDKEVFEEIEKLAKEFRFEHVISLDKPLDPNVAYQRVKQEIKSILGGNVFVSGKNTDIRRSYLSGAPELKEWLQLSIENRLLQSDSHHIDAKARVVVQAKLLELGGLLVERSLLKSPWDIFTCSIDQIAEYMKITSKE